MYLHLLVPLALVGTTLAGPAGYGKPSKQQCGHGPNEASRQSHPSSSGRPLKRFDFELTWVRGSPDGQERMMVNVNGQFPGPQMTLDYGDDVEVHVTNKLPGNATIHFHGIDQLNTPWSDGVPGLSQRPIESQGTYIYRWTAMQWGSYWYHGHYKSQMADGLYGPLLIHPPKDAKKPFSLITNDSGTLDAINNAESNGQSVILSDWTKFTSAEYTAASVKANLDAYCVDSILINGRGSVQCKGIEFLNSLLNPNLGKLLAMSNQTVTDKGCTPMNKLAFTEGDFNNTDPSAIPPGLDTGCVATNNSLEVITVDGTKQWAVLHFISAASEKGFVVSIDEHPVWVFAVDGQYIYPQLADSFVQYNGERFSVLVQLDQTPGDYTIRVANFLSDQVIAGTATLSYGGVTAQKTNESTPYVNYAGTKLSNSTRELDENLLVPFDVPPPAAKADATYHLRLNRWYANYQWSVTNLSSFPLDRKDATPFLYDVNQTDAFNESIVIRTINGTWIDLIIESDLGPWNPAQPPHPMHKHANKGYLIGRGTGKFNYSSVADAEAAHPEWFNISTAQYRDSFTSPSILPTEAWIAVRYQVTNPGAWLFHCHISTHLSGGMAIVLLDGVDVWPTTPDEYLNGNGETGNYDWGLENEDGYEHYNASNGQHGQRDWQYFGKHY